MMGAGCRLEAPAAGGTRRLLRWGEPTGLVPRGAGAEDGFLRRMESHKKRFRTGKINAFYAINFMLT